MKTFRKGFTLIELLVVIGIIAILAGIMIASFGGATESARSAQCLTNLRTLAMSANSYAMSSNFYPCAGSVEKWTVGNGGNGTIYKEYPGWISWLSDGNYTGGSAASSQSNPTFPFYGTGNSDDTEYAFRHGSLWGSCNGNRSLYICPEHVRYRKQKGLSTPVFSYVMSAKFSWNSPNLTPSDLVDSGGTLPGEKYGGLSRADRMLMFAELPTVDVENDMQPMADKGGLASDCILQYLEIPEDGSVYASAEGDAESIGFVHTAGKGKPCGHLVFADCHTEKVVWREGDISPKELTAYLCCGIDLTLTSSGWKKAENADKAE